MASGNVGEDLERIRAAMTIAIRCWDISMELTEDQEVVDTLNRYKGFFTPVDKALQDAYIMGFAKLLDKNSKVLSLTKVLKCFRDDPKQYPINLELQELIDELSAHKEVTKKIKSLRDQYIAHLDRDPDMTPTDRKIDIGTKEQWQEFIATLQKIHEKLTYAHNQSITRPDYDRTKEDTKAVCAALKTT